jgi:hypothetical protein
MFAGKNCDINKDECISSPCKGGGQCFDGVNDYMCVCPSHLAGKDCDRQQTCLDGMEFNPLLHKYTVIAWPNSVDPDQPALFAF